MRNKKRILFTVLFFLFQIFLIPAIGLAENRFNMSYLYFGSPDTYIEKVDVTHNSLSMVAPNYFELNPDGSLLVTGKYNGQFVTEMHSRGIKVVPFLTNNWDRTDGRAALTNREALSTQIANAVRDLNLDGVDMDIENLTEIDKDNYTDFMRLLRSKIPSTKQVSIAVAANPSGWTQGWQASYDYLKLSQVLTGSRDYLMIMAYDESWEGSDPGPVASLSFMEKSIKYALNKGVPPGKIVCGLPFYGRFWKSDGTIVGTGISHWQVYELQNKYQGQITYDTTSQTPKMTFTIHPGDPGSTISYKQLTTGDYQVWFDNETSIKKKLDLVRQYNLKGSGSWSLTQEQESMWDYYSLWLNGLFFSDVLNHWAQSYIYTVQAKGWMVGTSSSTFSPDEPLTRAQGATILIRALGYDQATPTTPFPFTDVSSSYWARKYIHLAKEKGIINGTTLTTFEPDAPLTREQMAKMLNNLLKYSDVPLPASSPYSDLTNDRWSYQAIINLTEHKIFSGFIEDNHLLFKPIGQTTRAEMATLMSRLVIDIEALK